MLKLAGYSLQIIMNKKLLLIAAIISVIGVWLIYATFDFVINQPDPQTQCENLLWKARIWFCDAADSNKSPQK